MTKTTKHRWLIAVCWLLCATSLAQAQPAFPGAVGFGSDTTHGRGGRVVHVTTLADSGPGTLREALTATGKRIIVFDVAGIIKLQDQITIGPENSEFYLAGQSAPGTGVVVVGATIKIEGARDFLIRHMRFRRGDFHYMANAGEGDSLWILGAAQAVIDHCSIQWGWDGNLDLKQFCDMTVSHTMIGNGCNEAIHGQDSDWWHNKLMLLGDSNCSRQQNRRLSLYRNVFCYGDDRPPQLCDAGTADFVNNIFFANNVASCLVGRSVQKGTGKPLFADPDYGWQANFLGNYWRNLGSPQQSLALGIWGNGVVHPATRLYLEGNLNDHFAPTAATVDQAKIIDGGDPQRYLASKRIEIGSPPNPYTILTAAEAFAAVLKDVGVTVPRRDFVDADLLKRIRLEQYSIDLDTWGPFPEFRYTKIGMDSQLQVTGQGYLAHDFSVTAPLDSDGDGMPDAWEDDHGLDKVDATDHGRLLASGYTAIETYLNGLASGPDEPLPERDLPDPRQCLFDGSFEYGVCNWRSRACGIRETTKQAHTGKSSVEVFNRKGDRRNYLQQRVIDDLHRHGPGRYCGTAWVKLKAGATPTTAKVALLWLDRTDRRTVVAREVTLGSALVTDAAWTKLSGSGEIAWTEFAKGDGTWPGGAYFAVELEENKDVEYLVDECSLTKIEPSP